MKYLVLLSLLVSEMIFADTRCSHHPKQELCAEYHSIGEAQTICRWRREFPVLFSASLADREAMYVIAKEHCRLWKDSEPFLFHKPDLGGLFCYGLESEEKLKEQLDTDPLKAKVCMQFQLTKREWRSRALQTLHEGLGEENSTTKWVIEQLIEQQVQEKQQLNEHYASLLEENQTLDLTLPVLIKPFQSWSQWGTQLVLSTAVFTYLWCQGYLAPART